MKNKKYEIYMNNNFILKKKITKNSKALDKSPWRYPAWL